MLRDIDIMRAGLNALGVIYTEHQHYYFNEDDEEAEGVVIEYANDDKVTNSLLYFDRNGWYLNDCHHG